MRLLGLDPGLRLTGWGVVEADRGRLRHVANGTIASDAGLETAARLVQLYDGVAQVIARHAPEAAAVEETFVNKNAATTLKLGLARGVVLLAPARAGLPVAEYPANLVKKSIVGAGHAGKEQIQAMVRHLLPGIAIDGPDAADALAVAICHAHHAATLARWRAVERAPRVPGP
ncbi:MAG TPA: crossover junction endodeoxyribonuclease RuvC [Alphaproteobacteria bacterium]|nr:crossover junction endodeoxyribonuclease RuvC [Alphaproteobacteria bacterium]